MQEAESDDDLIRACGKGSVDAFNQLFQRYQQPVWGYFRRRLRDAARAEDLTQDTFIAVFRAASRFEARSSFRTFLYGIAANLLAAERRQPIPAPVAVTPVSPPHDDVLWIRDALARLDDGDRDVLMLREFEALTYAEIAGVLEVPINTVRSRLFRARLALREQLTPPTISGRPRS